jgi:uncharacterized protein
MPPAPPGGHEAAVRIVLDTNVALAALLWRGTPYRLLDSIRHQEQMQLFASIVLLEELAEVLTRPVLSKRLAVIGLTARQVLADYIDVVDLVAPSTVPAVIAADPDDDHVLAAAVAAAADLIVSGDQHLLTLQAHGNVRIVTPTIALRLIATP